MTSKGMSARVNAVPESECPGDGIRVWASNESKQAGMVAYWEE